jgi:hypothetical protein
MAEPARHSLVCWALDAAMTASLRPRRRLPEQLRTLMSPRSTGYDRVAAAVNAVDRLIPGCARRATSVICRPLALPFPADRVELLAFGSGATVFLATGAGRARVVKVYRRSLGVPRRRLPDVLDRYRAQYDETCRLYRDAPGVVWPAEFMIVGGPILERPAVACVQEYLPGPLRDFFTDLTEAEAIAALSASPELRRQFVAFARPTLDLRRAAGRMPDFLGERNLALAGVEPAARLRLIDYRIMPVSDHGAPRVRQERCLERIAALLEAFG